MKSMVIMAGLLAMAAPLRAQSTLTLTDAVAAARAASPELRAAREAVETARGLERQAGAWSNPLLGWSHEQTGGASAQNIVGVEQTLDITGQRGARRSAARLRREAAELLLRLAQTQLDDEVVGAYAAAVSTARLAALADVAAAAFTRAVAVSEQRLAAGDVSGYAHRRLRLEAARYAVRRAEAHLAGRAAHALLASLTGGDPGSPPLLVDTAALPPPRLPPTDSLERLALAARADLRAAGLRALAQQEETRLARAARLPLPTLSAGLKSERTVAGTGTQHGFAAGLSFPLALFDRRGGAISASAADARRLDAEGEALRRRIAREVRHAREALIAVSEQLELLGPRLGEEARAALAAAELAWQEGDIPLVEWLDAVRAYQESEAGFSALRAEALIRRAALLRAMGYDQTQTMGIF